MAKAFNLSKSQVFTAYKLVRANRGAGGIDEQTLTDFDLNLKRNLYKIWNRLNSGSYFPPPVKEVEIPKACGGTRKLGIPTISDRVAQMAIRLSFEEKVEPYFHKDSYGYRPKRSAHDAIAITRKRCWKYDFVLEFDIKGLFDNIEHDLLMKAVKHHTQNKMELLYIERWLKAPVRKANGELVKRKKGTPQGGVISPVLANLFLHYAFDKWLERTQPHLEFCRYADDGLIHFKTQRQAEYMRVLLTERMKECGLELHPDKTKIIYCSSKGKVNKRYEHNSFDFLGYTFRRRTAVDPRGRKFCSFLPAISNKAKKRIKTELRAINVQALVYKDLRDIANLLNPKIRGWFYYYGRFTKSEMREIEYYLDGLIRRWLQKKFKKLLRRPRKSQRLLNKLRKSAPKLFAHWSV